MHGPSVTVLFLLKPGRASQSSTRPSAQSFLTTWYGRRRQLPGSPIFERRVNREAQPGEGLAWGHDPIKASATSALGFLNSDFVLFPLSRKSEPGSFGAERPHRDHSGEPTVLEATPYHTSQQPVNHFTDGKIGARKGWATSTQSRRQVWPTQDGSSPEPGVLLTVCVFSFS